MGDEREPTDAASGVAKTQPRMPERVPTEPPPPTRPKTAEPVPRVKAAQLSMADMLVGTVLADRYQLLEKIGEGAMGWVFLAEHTEIGKKLAIKVMRPSLCRMPEAVSRFRREARAATKVGNKHIVDVTDFGTTPSGAVFFAMEYLENGEDLGTTLKREGRLAWTRVQNLLLQLCEALQAAHDAGIIHRDVKPANFYRVPIGDPSEASTGSEMIKVLDFGIARLANPTDSIVTQTGVVMGTPDFMAPEQAQGRHVDHRADIYSLGATAWALVVGRPPFSGKNEYDIIHKHLTEPPRPPSMIVRDVPEWFDDVLLKAMAKEPGARWASMADFAKALRNPADKSTERGRVERSHPTVAHALSIPMLVLGALALAVIGGLVVYLIAG
ncbi:MAG TPA: serine/threonine-protein kinase [Nannocystaceae bacterium]|nr:serine/threonine-protein kinase [Nannocystaceae bacterium]